MAANPQPPVSATGTPLTRKPSIYAEFLPRLGRISVVIHLPTPSTHKTKVLLARDGMHLIVDHEGASTRLRLPAKTRIAGEHLPGEVKPGLDKMSWRLFPTPEEAQAALDIEAGAVPWSAADLKPGLLVACRKCDELIISRDTIEAFKDLPSENWAEMMEFWHCHKPADAHGDGYAAAAGVQKKASEDQLASRGYGANSTISAQDGVGFVDLMTVLFSQNDCSCLLVSISNLPGPGPPNPFPTSYVPSLPDKGIKEGVRLLDGAATYTFARDRTTGPSCAQRAAKRTEQTHRSTLRFARLKAGANHSAFH